MLSNCKRLTVCAVLVLATIFWLCPLTAPAIETEIAAGPEWDPTGLTVTVPEGSESPLFDPTVERG